jgi:hypothetical protein
MDIRVERGLPTHEMYFSRNPKKLLPPILTTKHAHRNEHSQREGDCNVLQRYYLINRLRAVLFNRCLYRCAMSCASLCLSSAYVCLALLVLVNSLSFALLRCLEVRTEPHFSYRQSISRFLSLRCLLAGCGHINTSLFTPSTSL